MSYSTITHALINYVESHLTNMNVTEMAKSFGFSETYLRELFYRHVNMPIMQYYKRRKLIASAFELLHSVKKSLRSLWSTDSLIRNLIQGLFKGISA